MSCFLVAMMALTTKRPRPLVPPATATLTIISGVILMRLERRNTLIDAIDEEKAVD